MGSYTKQGWRKTDRAWSGSSWIWRNQESTKSFLCRIRRVLSLISRTGPALSEPTPVRIENAVHHIVMDRLNDGQFDDCDITLKELHRMSKLAEYNAMSDEDFKHFVA